MTLDDLEARIRAWLACQATTRAYDAESATRGDQRDWRRGHLQCAFFENQARTAVVGAVAAMHISAGTWYQCGNVDLKVDRDGNIWTKGSEA